MTQEHPITPPPELITKWASSMCGYYEAARWGADMELEACCEWIVKTIPSWAAHREVGEQLRAARRPNPPSLKEQALGELDLLKGDANAHGLGFDAPAIRRALESLPD